MPLELGKFGAWFNPVYEDAVRVRFVAEAEALGYTTAWLGMGRRSMADLKLIEQALDATTTIVVASASAVPTSCSRSSHSRPRPRATRRFSASTAR